MPGKYDIDFNEPDSIDLEKLTRLLRNISNQPNEAVPSKLCRVGENPSRQYPKYLEGITLSHSIFIVQMEMKNRFFIIDHKQKLGNGAFAKVLGIKGEIILPQENSEQASIDFHEIGQFALKVSEQRVGRDRYSFTSKYTKEALYNKVYYDEKEFFMGRSSHAKFSINRRDRTKGRFLTPFLDAVPQSVLDQISSERLRQYKKLEFAIDFLKELRRIHQLGLVHSDIKPDNVMMLESDNNYQCCLIDFGLTGPNDAKCDSIVGSYNYMAPWLLKDIKIENHMIFKYANDIYAAGVMMFELFIDKGNDSSDYKVISTVYDNLTKIAYFNFVKADKEKGALSILNNTTPECLSHDGRVTEIEENLHEVFTSMVEVTPELEGEYEVSLNFLGNVIQKLSDIQSDIAKLGCEQQNTQMVM